MVGSKPLPRDDGFQFPINDLERACTIDKARHVVRLRAVVFGAHVLGRCGAADPGAEVSVRREQSKILDEFLMEDNCGTGTTSLEVTTLEFSEQARALSLSATILDEQGGSTPLALTYDFKAATVLTLEKVWAAIPTSSRNDSVVPAQ